MPHKSARFSFALTVVLTGIWLLSLPGWAAIYVSDRLEAPLRNGPGTQYRIISMLRSGQPVEVLEEQQGWSHVRLAAGARDREGWILTRYLMNREPWEWQARELEAEIRELRETASPMERDLRAAKASQARLEAALQTRTEEFERLKDAHESLKEEASEFLALQQDFDRIRDELSAARKTLGAVAKEKELLQSSQAYRWFLAGAGVLLSGLLIGLLVGRREKKHSSRLYL